MPILEFIVRHTPHVGATYMEADSKLGICTPNIPVQSGVGRHGFHYVGTYIQCDASFALEISGRLSWVPLDIVYPKSGRPRPHSGTQTYHN